MERLLTDTQPWKRDHLDGPWEPDYDIEVGTLDYAGCYIKVNLVGTFLEDREFTFKQPPDAEGVWLECCAKNKKFIGYGSSHHEEALLAIFLEWAKNEPSWVGLSDETPGETKRREANALWSALGPKSAPNFVARPAAPASTSNTASCAAPIISRCCGGEMFRDGVAHAKMLYLIEDSV